MGEPLWKRVLRREVAAQHGGDVGRKVVGDAVAEGVGYAVVVHGCVVDDGGGIVVAVEYARKGSS